MRIAVLGGGPAGLYFAISMKLRSAEHEITVFERNRPDDTFGWGVVLSAETLDNLTANDPVSATWIKRHFAYWDDIAVIHGGVRTVSTGHGFCGIGRKRLLVPLPWPVARLMSTVLGLLPKPLLTSDQVELLKRDNVVSDAAIEEGRTLAGLDIAPCGIEAIVPAYLYRYRKAGQFSAPGVVE